MPLDHYDWIEKREILTYEEIERLVRLSIPLGVQKVRLTGGEPLLRRDLDKLIQRLSQLEGLDELCLTTNGVLLGPDAEQLRHSGLRRVNVSLDTLDPDKFERITKKPNLPKVLEGLRAAQQAGLDPVKVNMVVERGVNDDEIVAMAQFCSEHGFALRYIEFMDVGNANAWNLDRVVTKKEILATLGSHFDLQPAGRHRSSDPATRFQVRGGGPDLGVIASVTEPFCDNCSRARITADGKFVTCLFSQDGTDLKRPLRDRTTDEDLGALLRLIWTGRTDAFSEDRLRAILSDHGYQPQDRHKIEMITLGG